MKYDICIIGAGIVGCSIAFELSKFDLNVLVLEKENDVSMKTTKANSAIIHAGYDPEPSTKMARLNVEGSELVHEASKTLGFHYNQIGSLVIGRTKEDHDLIDVLYERGMRNGVKGLKVLKTREELLALGEEHLESSIDYALYAPTAAVVAPWEMALAFITNAVYNGAVLKLSSGVKAIEKTVGGYEIRTESGDYESTFVINCAGLNADSVFDMINDDKSRRFEIEPVRGEYYLLDKNQAYLAKHVIFQTPNKDGKGVLVSPTVHGNLIVGPNAINDGKGKNYVGNTSDSMAFVKDKAKLSIPDINYRNNIRNFSGNRAHVKGYDDFIIDEPIPGFYNFAGIKSPGLSCSLAFGKELVRMMQSKGYVFRNKESFKTIPLPEFEKNLSSEEKDKLISADPRFGRIICRCETISEGEIVRAIHSLVPATTIDGVKRRTNAGMGRCQGGFCAPKVFSILMRELHLSYDEVYQDRNGSQIVIGKTKEGK